VLFDSFGRLVLQSFAPLPASTPQAVPAVTLKDYYYRRAACLADRFSVEGLHGPSVLPLVL